MNEKEINLVEKLKDVPFGTKFYSPIFGDVIFAGINEAVKCCIRCYINMRCIVTFTSKGLYYEQFDGECMLFPSKDKRDWSTFKYVPRPKHKFKPYDKVLVRSNGEWEPAFFSHYDYTYDNTYVTMNNIGYPYCIPFEGNESLVFTNEMPKGGEE